MLMHYSDYIVEYLIYCAVLNREGHDYYAQLIIMLYYVVRAMIIMPV